MIKGNMNDFCVPYVIPHEHRSVTSVIPHEHRSVTRWKLNKEFDQMNEKFKVSLDGLMLLMGYREYSYGRTHLSYRSLDRIMNIIQGHSIHLYYHFYYS